MLGAGIKNCIFLVVLFTRLRVEDVDSSYFKRYTPTIEGEEKEKKIRVVQKFKPIFLIGSLAKPQQVQLVDAQRAKGQISRQYILYMLEFL